MAIDVKAIIYSSFLNLCEKENIGKISIKEILEDSGVSRQTFYNHFLDKNDLICHIYTDVIIPDFNGEKEIDFYDSLLAGFENMKKNEKFMREACLIEGQNCLKDYIFSHCKEFDLKWHCKFFRDGALPQELRFATEYHSMASSSMTLSWIVSGMPVSCKELAELITELRAFGMSSFFSDGKALANPYEKT